MEIKTVEVEKKTVITDTDRHKETVVKEVVKPDGTKEKVTITTEDTNRKTDSKDAISKTSDASKEVTRSSAKVSISALAGINLGSISAPSVFGVAITKPLLGPITVGAWSLNNGILGMSLGLTF